MNGNCNWFMKFVKIFPLKNNPLYGNQSNSYMVDSFLAKCWIVLYNIYYINLFPPVYLQYILNVANIHHSTIETD